MEVNVPSKNTNLIYTINPNTNPYKTLILTLTLILIILLFNVTYILYLE